MSQINGVITLVLETEDPITQTAIESDIQDILHKYKQKGKLVTQKMNVIIW